MNQNSPSTEYYSQESRRLLFRAMNEDDVALWTPFFIDNESQRFVGAAHLKLSANEKANNWIEKQMNRASKKLFGQLAVIDKSDNRFIGVGGILERNIEGITEYEVTYSLLPHSWGNGYATELAIHFKEFAFNNIETSSVISIIHVENEASINVAEKNGMHPESEMTFMDMPVRIYRARL